MGFLRRRIQKATTVPSYAPRTLMDYSNRELREMIGDLRIEALDLRNALLEARMLLAAARGEDVLAVALEGLPS